jgi:hypothetical protein
MPARPDLPIRPCGSRRRATFQRENEPKTRVPAASVLDRCFTRCTHNQLLLDDALIRVKELRESAGGHRLQGAVIAVSVGGAGQQSH